MSRHKVEDQNPFDICARLELSVPQGGESEDGLWLNAYLNFGSEPISSKEVSFRLGVKAGFLKLELENCRAVLGTRYAMLHQPASIARETTEEEVQHEKSQRELGVAAKIKTIMHGIDAESEVGASASRGRSHERTVTTTIQGKAETRKVTARGTHAAPSWEIGEPEGQRLNGSYLGQDDLCQLAADQANYSATARFVCLKRDLALDFDPEPAWLLIKPNKQKLALALIAKQLGRDDVDGEIELCKSKLGVQAEEG